MQASSPLCNLQSGAESVGVEAINWTPYRFNQIQRLTDLQDFEILLSHEIK